VDLQLGAPTLPAAGKAAAAALRVLLRLAREWESRGRERRAERCGGARERCGAVDAAAHGRDAAHGREVAQLLPLFLS